MFKCPHCKKKRFWYISCTFPKYNNYGFKEFTPEKNYVEFLSNLSFDILFLKASMPWWDFGPSADSVLNLIIKPSVKSNSFVITDSTDDVINEYIGEVNPRPVWEILPDRLDLREFSGYSKIDLGYSPIVYFGPSDQLASRDFYKFQGLL